MSKKTTEIVSQMLEPIVEVEGVELVDVVFVKEGSDWVLRVFIENPEGELNLQHCENVSRLLSEELDKKDPIEQSYILEVSSPGIERPLKKEEDYHRFKGELVKIKTYAPVENKKEFVGTLNGIEDQEVLIELKEEGVIRIPWNKIADAHLTFEF